METYVRLNISIPSATLNLYLSNQCILQSQSKKKKYNLYDLQLKKRKKKKMFSKRTQTYLGRQRFLT